MIKNIPSSSVISVTTIPTTTYSTHTTVTTERYFDGCPNCLRKDFVFIPKILYYQPIKVKTYIECQEICRWMTLLHCKFYNFYTEHFQGQLHGGNCVLFRERVWGRSGRIPMKNVISASIKNEMVVG